MARPRKVLAQRNGRVALDGRCTTRGMRFYVRKDEQRCALIRLQSGGEFPICEVEQSHVKHSDLVGERVERLR